MAAKNEVTMTKITKKARKQLKTLAVQHDCSMIELLSVILDREFQKGPGRSLSDPGKE